MIPFYQLAPPAALRFAVHYGQFHGLALARSTFEERGFKVGRRYPERIRTPDVHLPRAPPASLLQVWKLQEPFGCEPLQQLPALVILQPSIGSFPVQQLADGTRDLGYSEGGKLQRD